MIFLIIRIATFVLFFLSSLLFICLCGAAGVTLVYAFAELFGTSIGNFWYLGVALLCSGLAAVHLRRLLAGEVGE